MGKMLNFCFFFLRILEVNSFFLRRNVLYKQTEPGMCWCTLGSCLGKRVAEGRGVLFFPSSAALGSLDLTPWQHRSDLNPQKQSAQGSIGAPAVLCCAVLCCLQHQRLPAAESILPLWVCNNPSYCLKAIFACDLQ